MRELLNSMSGNVTRSSCLAPLQWTLGILVSGLVGCAAFGAPSWLLVTLAVFVGVTLVSFVGLAVWFSINEPDNLRSERYSIKKMEIERGLVGDNLTGFINKNRAVSVADEPKKLIEEGQEDE